MIFIEIWIFVGAVTPLRNIIFGCLGTGFVQFQKFYRYTSKFTILDEFEPLFERLQFRDFQGCVEEP